MILQCHALNYELEDVQRLNQNLSITHLSSGRSVEHLASDVLLIESSKRSVYEAKAEIVALVKRLRGTVPYFSNRFEVLSSQLRGVTLTRHADFGSIIRMCSQSVFEQPASIKVQQRDAVQYEGIIADIMVSSFLVEADLIARCMNKLNANFSIESADPRRLKNIGWAGIGRELDILNFKRNVAGKTMEQLFQAYTLHIDNLFEHFVFRLCHALSHAFHKHPVAVMRDIVDEDTGEILVGWRRKHEENGSRDLLHRCFQESFDDVIGNITDYDADGFGMFSVLYRDVLKRDKLTLNSNCIMQSLLEMYFLFRLRFSDRAVRLRVETEDKISRHPFYPVTQWLLGHGVSHWATQLGRTRFRSIYDDASSINQSYGVDDPRRLFVLSIGPLIDIYNQYVPNVAEASYLTRLSGTF